MNDTGLVIPLAIKAGLGDYGRNQMVITPEFGPRLRFSKIFTSLPLIADEARRHGISQYCGICTKCASACPVKALPFGEPSEEVPNRSTISGVRKWSADCEKCFSYWAKLKSDCAICMRVCPFNRDFSKPDQPAVAMAGNLPVPKAGAVVGGTFPDGPAGQAGRLVGAHGGRVGAHGGWEFSLLGLFQSNLEIGSSDTILAESVLVDEFWLYFQNYHYINVCKLLCFKFSSSDRNMIARIFFTVLLFLAR